MFTLTKTRFYNSDAFKIEFDEWDCFSSFGPFFDILASYAEESGISPKRIQPIYQYQFTEDERRTEFYWDGSFNIFVFDIAPFQYEKIQNRLKKICAALNRRIREEKRFKNRPQPSGVTHEKFGGASFKLCTFGEPNILRIVFDGWESVSGFGPYYDVLLSYSKEAGTVPKRVTRFLNYLFVEDGYNIQLQWDAVSTIYVYYIAPEQYRMIYGRLRKICGDLNRRIAEKKYFEKYGELPNRGRGFL